MEEPPRFHASASQCWVGKMQLRRSAILALMSNAALSANNERNWMGWLKRESCHRSIEATMSTQAALELGAATDIALLASILERSAA